MIKEIIGKWAVFTVLVILIASFTHPIWIAPIVIWGLWFSFVKYESEVQDAKRNAGSLS